MSLALTHRDNVKNQNSHIFNYNYKMYLLNTTVKKFLVTYATYRIIYNTLIPGFQRKVLSAVYALIS